MDQPLGQVNPQFSSLTVPFLAPRHTHHICNLEPFTQLCVECLSLQPDSTAQEGQALTFCLTWYLALWPACHKVLNRLRQRRCEIAWAAPAALRPSPQQTWRVDRSELANPELPKQNVQTSWLHHWAGPKAIFERAIWSPVSERQNVGL